MSDTFRDHTVLTPQAAYVHTVDIPIAARQVNAVIAAYQQ